MNIALIGYGKTGKEIEFTALERGHFITAIFTKGNPLPDAHSDFYKTAAIDCCIDFSAPDAVERNVTIAAQLRIPIVVGATGWYEKLEKLSSIVKHHNAALLYGSNFSIGAQIFLRVVSRASRLMNAFPQYDVSIHETHHTQKKDAPSGTALTIAKKILNYLQRKKQIKLPSDASPLQNDELCISSSRVGSVFGIHSVLFNSPFDEIELTHRAHNRKGFALGAVMAAEWVQEMSGVYTIEEIIFDKLNYLDNE